jgi:glucuronoarabinoxylan endo-1,4-beta-xylanase
VETIGNANGLLNAAGVLQPRAYVMAQFTKFVRPNDVRIDVPSNSSPLGMSAFMDPNSGRFAIVAVNDTTLPVTQSFTINGITISSLTPWVTSGTQSLEQQSALAVREGAFTYTVPSFSVVTFTGVLHKLTMCHNGQTISIDLNAVPAHLAIGDQVGSCS